MVSETERVRRIYDKVADRYDGTIRLSEKLFMGDGRRWVCSQARGNVLEIAVGTGRNLPLYPQEVRLTGVDLSPAMLAVARQRAHRLGRAVDLRVGDAQALDFLDASFDTVVCTLPLCTIPDDRRAVAEAVRVLRPGGRLLLLEHVRSSIAVVRAVQRLLEPALVRLQADHLLRDPLDYLTSEELEIERLERSRWGIVERLLARKRQGQVDRQDAPSGRAADA
jgi:ubiquinone/menaquinone biosynthesis C-methylase UbiE